DDGLSLEISLEQDAPVLRDAAPQPLPDGTTYRLLAVEVSSNELLALADGVMGFPSPALTVPASADCKFYALSNKTTGAISPAYTVGNILTTLAVGNTQDFLLWSSGTNAMLKEGDGSYLLNITFRQELARVKLIIDSQSTGKAIETIANNITIGQVVIDGTLSYPTGVVTPSGTLSSPAFSWPTPASTQESRVCLVFPKASGVLTVTLPANAIKLRDVATSIPTIQTPITFTTALERGNSYTIRVKILKIAASTGFAKFASSNIYWDGEKLTFAPYTSTPLTQYTTEQQYQGVFFKFGSLVGGSPVGNFSVSSTILYVPYYGNGTSPGWQSSFATKTTDDVSNFPGVSVGHGSWTSWQNIVYITDGTSADRSNYHVMDPARNTPTMWNSYIGDICQYISATQPGLSGYRLPMSIEFGKNSDWGSYTGTIGGTDSDDGKRVIDAGNRHTGGNGVFFPMSNYRKSSDGSLNVITTVQYMSGSTRNANSFFILYFGSNTINVANYIANNRDQYAFTVRCVLQE
ncbi:MAG: hypothetical protein LBS46_03685, partial [Dysgonamonadaceae bacterium]|nr:hypothetical protein [Dysgonamonadaceae bacterium]